MRFPRSSGILLTSHFTGVAAWHRRPGGRSPAIRGFPGRGGAEALAGAAAGSYRLRRLALSVPFGVGGQSNAHQPGATGGTRLVGSLRAGRGAPVSRGPRRFRTAGAMEDCILESAAERGSGFEAFCDANQHWLDDFAFPALKSQHDGVGMDAMGTGRARSGSESAGQVAAAAGWRQSLRKSFCSSFSSNSGASCASMRENAASGSWATCRFMYRTIARTCGLNRAVFPVWTRRAIRRRCPACRRIISARPASLWGNPIYRWDALARDGYGWWLDRFRATFEMVDMIRLGSFSRLRGVLGGSGIGKDRGEWQVGEGSGSGVVSRG